MRIGHVLGQPQSHQLQTALHGKPTVNGMEKPHLHVSIKLQVLALLSPYLPVQQLMPIRSPFAQTIF